MGQWIECKNCGYTYKLNTLEECSHCGANYVAYGPDASAEDQPVQTEEQGMVTDPPATAPVPLPTRLIVKVREYPGSIFPVGYILSFTGSTLPGNDEWEWYDPTIHTYDYLYGQRVAPDILAQDAPVPVPPEVSVGSGPVEADPGRPSIGDHWAADRFGGKSPRRNATRHSLTTIKRGAGKDGYDLWINGEFIYGNIRKSK